MEVYANLLVVTATEEDIRKIEYLFTKDDIRDKKSLSLDLIKPQPREFMYEESGNSLNIVAMQRAIEWRLENWGSRWEVSYSLGDEYQPEIGHFYFLSHESIPTPAILELSRICKGMTLTLFSAEISNPGKYSSVQIMMNGVVETERIYMNNNDAFNIYAHVHKKLPGDFEFIKMDSEGHYYYEPVTFEEMYKTTQVDDTPSDFLEFIDKYNYQAQYGEIGMYIELPEGITVGYGHGGLIVAIHYEVIFHGHIDDDGGALRMFLKALRKLSKEPTDDIYVKMLSILLILVESNLWIDVDIRKNFNRPGYSLTDSEGFKTYAELEGSPLETTLSFWRIKSIVDNYAPHVVRL